MPSGGGGGFPMSGLQGMFSGFGGGFPARAWRPPAGLGSGMQPPPASFGADLGRGLAASAAAAGGGVPPVAAVPPAPMTPLAAPIESAPTSAAAAAAPVSAPAPAPARRTASTCGRACRRAVWHRMGRCCRPGHRLCRRRRGRCRRRRRCRPGAVDIPAAAGAGAGLLPVAGRRDGAPVRRDLAESDLELARLAVAELAGAGSVVDAGTGLGGGRRTQPDDLGRRRCGSQPTTEPPTFRRACICARRCRSRRGSTTTSMPAGLAGSIRPRRRCGRRGLVAMRWALSRRRGDGPRTSLRTPNRGARGRDSVCPRLVRIVRPRSCCRRGRIVCRLWTRLCMPI